MRGKKKQDLKTKNPDIRRSSLSNTPEEMILRGG